MTAVGIRIPDGDILWGLTRIKAENCDNLALSLQLKVSDCKFFLESASELFLLKPMQTERNTRISIERLKQDLRELSKIGRDDDGGVHRMAFTKADMEGKDWLETKMKEAGLDTRRDSACNVIGRMEGEDPNAPVLIIGSHIDTVPCAGILDGTLGVLSGLECLRQLIMMMLGICFFTLGVNTLKAPLQEGEKGVAGEKGILNAQHARSNADPPQAD